MSINPNPESDEVRDDATPPPADTTASPQTPEVAAEPAPAAITIAPSPARPRPSRNMDASVVVTVSTTKATPRLAPDPIPRIDGPARGLWKKAERVI